MKKPLFALAVMYAALALTACNSNQGTPQVDANGNPVPQAQSHSDNSWIWGAGLGYLMGRMSAPSAAPAAGYAPQVQQPHYQPTPQPERRSWWQRNEQPRAAVTTPSLPPAAVKPAIPTTPAAPSVIPNFAKPSVPNGYQAPTITMKPSTGLAAPAAPAPKPSMPSYSAPARSYSSTPSYSAPSRSYSSPSYSSSRR